MISAMNNHIRPMTNNTVIGRDFQQKTKTLKVCIAIALKGTMRITDYGVLRTTYERPVRSYISDLNKI